MKVNSHVQVRRASCKALKGSIFAALDNIQPTKMVVDILGCKYKDIYLLMFLKEGYCQKQ